MLELRAIGARMGPPSIAPVIEIAIEVRARRPVAFGSLILQTRIEPRLRTYSASERQRLVPLFGGTELGGRALESIFWSRSTLTLGAFDERCELTMSLPCSVDLEQAIGKLAMALEDGSEIPISIVARGHLFHQGASGLEMAPIAHSLEASYRLPVALIRGAHEHAQVLMGALS